MADDLATREYENIRVIGPVSIEPTTDLVDTNHSWLILCMGPTGAGKSTFIETFGLSDDKRISSNQLEGFTQGMSTYKLNGIVDVDGDPIYLLDSPGFADTKISEMSIVSMLQEWRQNNGNAMFSRILYHTPITHVRLPGSLRRILKTFRALTNIEASKRILILTTMWDSMYGERLTKRAEETYRQLETSIWKDFIDNGAQIVKFYNTKESALLILDEALHMGPAKFFNVETTDRNWLPHSAFAANLSADLQDRISSRELEITTIRLDLADAKAQRESPPAVAHANLERTPTMSAHASAGTERVLHHEAEQPPRGRLLNVLEFVMGCGCCGKAVQANHNT